MSAIPLHIVMHGLIALLPHNQPDGANHMTALLVDARQAPAEMNWPCFAEHVPTLMVDADSAECRAAGCTASGNHCVCTLSRQEITLSIDPPPSPAKSVLAKKPQNSLPFSLSGADDFSYIANLTLPPMSLKLNQSFLDPIPPHGLVARMGFPFEAAKACSLGTRPDEGNRNVHPMSFRLHGDLEKSGEVGQALAQQILTWLTLERPVTVKLTISGFDGGNPHVLTLKPVTNNLGLEGYWIELSNMRKNDTFPDEPCDDGVGRDFGFFYELAQDKPDWAHRPIPHIKYTRWKSARDLTTDDCTRRLTHVPSSRPICAVATFN